MSLHPILLLSASILLASCASPDGGASYAPASPPSDGSTHQLRERGSMSLQSRNLEESSQACVALVATHRGTLQSAQLTEDEYRATIRVPGTSLKPLMSSLSEVGTVTSKQVSADDVTATYRDLEARIVNKRALRDRLRSLLSKASSIKDTLAIEKELTEVQSELDLLEGQMKLLRSQVAQSVLEVDINRQKIPGPLGAVSKSSGWLLKKLFVLN
jgi:hypothetical protein